MAGGAGLHSLALVGSGDPPKPPVSTKQELGLREEGAGSLAPVQGRWLDLEAAAENRAVGAKEDSLPLTREAATAVPVTCPQIPANVRVDRGRGAVRPRPVSPPPDGTHTRRAADWPSVPGPAPDSQACTALLLWVGPLSTFVSVPQFARVAGRGLGGPAPRAHQAYTQATCVQGLRAEAVGAAACPSGDACVGDDGPGSSGEPASKSHVWSPSVSAVHKNVSAQRTVHASL